MNRWMSAIVQLLRKIVELKAAEFGPDFHSSLTWHKYPHEFQEMCTRALKLLKHMPFMMMLYLQPLEWVI